MGNCQAIDAAALVIQHPRGKIERFYWPIPVNEVMRMNPDHYVSLIIPLPASSSDHHHHNQDDDKAVRFTRVKLLRPTDTLTLGHAYRLVTSQEVMEILKAKKHAKTKRQHQYLESKDKLLQEHQQGNQSSDTHHVVKKHDRRRQRTTPTATNTAASMRSKSWRPSLQSITESPSYNA